MRNLFLSEIFSGDVKEWIMYAIAMIVVVAGGIIVYRKEQRDKKNKTSSGDAGSPLITNMSLSVRMLLFTVLMIMLSSVLTYQLSHEKNFMDALRQDWWKGVFALMPVWIMFIIRQVKIKNEK